jgi:dual oxidase
VAATNNARICILFIPFVLQKITAYEYIPAFLGKKLPPYTGYKVDVHPGVSHVFQSSAFRFGHTLIPPGIYRRDETCDFKKTNGGKPAWRLCAHWWDSSVSEYDILVHLKPLVIE